VEEIPVIFTYNNREYRGVFSNVFGAGGAHVWHLSVDRYHRGELHYSDSKGWIFHSRSWLLADLVDYFSQLILAWYE
jgi:hypothetical protein